MKNELSSPASMDRGAIRAREGDPGYAVRTTSGICVLLLLIATTGNSVARTAHPTQWACMAEADFLKHGGKLITTKDVDLHNLDQAIPSFFCDRVACFGKVAFEFEVGEDGAPRNVRVTENTWKDRPTEHAAVLEERLLASRYAPPKLRRKLVCIETDWQLVFEAAEVKRQP